MSLGLALRTYQKCEAVYEETPVRRAYLVALEAEPQA